MIVKYLLFSDHEIGTFGLSLSDQANYNATEWFYIKDEKKDILGSVLINITSEEVDPQTGDKKVAQSESGEEDDIDENHEQSIDYRDLEISRSVKPHGSRNANFESHYARSGGGQGQRQSEYKGLHTQ
jgi:hypothetical protein